MLLNKEQEKAVYSDSKIIAVVAAAGSGKTHVLIERIYNLVKNRGVNTAVLKPITFTRKAAGELKERLVKLDINGVRADTFHSFCYALINGYATRLGYRFPVNAYDDHLSTSIIVDVMISHGFPYKDPMKNEKFRMSSVRVIRNTLEKVCQDHPEEWIRIDEEYQHRLKAYNAVDYSRMISETIRLLSTNPDVRAEIHNTWHYVMIDEFQDTDQSQMELIQLIDPKNLFIIGDFDQSIYGWRGARPENIGTVVDREGSELIHLKTNYRCAVSIIDKSNHLIAHNQNSLRVEAEPRDGADPGNCVAYGGGGDVWKRTGDLVKSLLRQYSPNEIAVLCRDNGREHYPVGCYAVSEALKGLGIPYKRITRDGSFWESYEIRNMIYTLNLIMNHNDRASWSKAIDFPLRRIGQADRVRIKEIATHERISLLEASKGIDSKLTKWVDAIQTLGNDLNDGVYPGDDCIVFFEDVVEKLKWRVHFKPLIGRKFYYIIERIKLQMKILARDGFPTILDFIEWWLSKETIKESPGMNAVEVSTIHSYKGLEIRVVIIPGVDADHFPKLSKKNLDLSEECRILYVGITRAMDECYVLFGEEPSQFIEWAELLSDEGIDDLEEEFLQ